MSEGGYTWSSEEINKAKACSWSVLELNRSNSICFIGFRKSLTPIFSKIPEPPDNHNNHIEQLPQQRTVRTINTFFDLINPLQCRLPAKATLFLAILQRSRLQSFKKMAESVAGWDWQENGNNHTVQDANFPEEGFQDEIVSWTKSAFRRSTRIGGNIFLFFYPSQPSGRRQDLGKKFRCSAKI